jgi:hypothetical protein
MARTTSTVPMRTGARGGAADSVWRGLLDVITEMIDDRTPTLGNVVSREATGDRGNVVVQLDTEDAPRTIGFARNRGQAYENGQRVVAMKNRSGDWFILGGLATGSASGADRAVNNEHIYDNAVDSRTIAPDSVGRAHLVPEAIGYNQIDSAIASDLRDIATQSWVTGKDYATENWVDNNYVAFSGNGWHDVQNRLEALENAVF